MVFCQGLLSLERRQLATEPSVPCSNVSPGTGPSVGVPSACRQAHNLNCSGRTSNLRLICASDMPELRRSRIMDASAAARALNAPPPPISFCEGSATHLLTGDVPMRIKTNHLLAVVVLQLGVLALPRTAVAGGEGGDGGGIGTCSTCVQSWGLGWYHYFVNDCCDPTFGAEYCFTAESAHYERSESRGNRCYPSHDFCSVGGGSGEV